MDIIEFQNMLPPEAVEKMEEVDGELAYLTPKGRSYLMFWLREKAHRAKIKGGANELPLYQGAELADSLSRAIRDDDFYRFDAGYMDYLYRQAGLSGFDEGSRQRLAEYQDEKKTLAELSILSEHLLDNEMVNTITKVLREEPKNRWYRDLIDVCEDSVALRKYYASLFDVAENEVFPVNGDKKLEEGTVVYMALADGAQPEAAIFVKRAYDREKDKTFSVFCHEGEDGLEYFTVSDAEAPMVPVAFRSGNDSNLERLFLWAKQALDFSDDVYLLKPSVTDIAMRFEEKHPAAVKQFRDKFGKLADSLQEAKVWTFGKGRQGEAIADAPAYAKIKAYRLLSMQFENTGSYSIPIRKLIDFMQEEVKAQQEFNEFIFGSMRQFAEMEAGREEKAKEASKEKEAVLQKQQDAKQKAPAER